MNASITQYKKAIKKQLLCCGATKKKLLTRLQTSLAEFEEEHPAPDTGILYDAFGPPEEMAKTLMEGVSGKEIEKYRRKKVVLRVIAGILVAALLLFTIYVFVVKQRPIVSSTEYHDYGPISTEANPEE